MSRLKTSLDNSPLSTRTKNIILKMAAMPVVLFVDLEDLTGHYFRFPKGVIDEFMRQPGAGKVTRDELVNYFHSRAGSLPSTHASFITAREAKAYHDTINEALHSIDASTNTYARLRELQRCLLSATIYVQRPNDKRPIFPR